MVIFSLSLIVQKAIFSFDCRNFGKEPITFYCNFDYSVFPATTFVTGRRNEICRTEKTSSCNVLLPEWEDVRRQASTTGTKKLKAVNVKHEAGGWLARFTADRETLEFYIRFICCVLKVFNQHPVPGSFLWSRPVSPFPSQVWGKLQRQRRQYQSVYTKSDKNPRLTFWLISIPITGYITFLSQCTVHSLAPVCQEFVLCSFHPETHPFLPSSARFPALRWSLKGSCSEEPGQHR